MRGRLMEDQWLRSGWVTQVAERKTRKTANAGILTTDFRGWGRR